MTLESFLKKLNNNTSAVTKIAEVFDCKSNDRIVYDIFPFVINENLKYDQVSVFYQKYIDGDIFKGEFYNYAEKVNSFIKYIWIYSKTFAYILSNSPLHEVIKKEVMHHTTSVYYANECIIAVDSIECLEKCIELGIKEELRPIFIFPDYKIILTMDGLSGEIIYDDTSRLDNIKIFANSSNLFLDKR